MAKGATSTQGVASDLARLRQDALSSYATIFRRCTHIAIRNATNAAVAIAKITEVGNFFTNKRHYSLKITRRQRLISKSMTLISNHNLIKRSYR